MSYKRIAFSSLVFVLIIVVLLLYICFVAFSMTFDFYISKQTMTEIKSEKLTVIIDAGHGGIDGGAEANGLIEKDLNLLIANKLREFLTLMNVNTVMTRDADIMLGDNKSQDLKARLEIAENTSNCIFVSIHMNKFPQNSVHGLQTFYSSSTNGSAKLAQCIQDACKAIDKDNNRKIKPDGGNIFILENTTKTAVLVECGFISNYNDASSLSSDEYQNKLAFCIYLGIKNYLYGS